MPQYRYTLQWPSVQLLDTRAGNGVVYKGIDLPLPPESGIYLVIQEAHGVIYVGRAQNLHTRWRHHHLLPELRALADVRIAYDLYPVDALAARELVLIEQYRPSLNRRPCSPGTPPYITAEQLHLLSKSDAREARKYLRECAGLCPSHPNALVICTGCLYNVWCFACQPWICACAYFGGWPMIDGETADALHLGLETWEHTNPRRPLWELDEQCCALGEKKGTILAFWWGLHSPTERQAQVIAQALGTTLPALVDARASRMAM